MNTKCVLGFVFILFSGIMFTLERVASKIAGYLELSGFLAGGKTGHIPLPKEASFFDNLFIPLFLIFGITLIFRGWYKRKEQNP